MIPLIISRLIETGHRVFLPIHRSHIIIVQRPLGVNQALLKCELQNASTDSIRSPVARELKDMHADLLGVLDGVTKTVWIIPRDALESRKSIRLGARYEEYVIPEPSSLSYKEQKEKRKFSLQTLKDQARETGEKKG